MVLNTKLRRSIILGLFIALGACLVAAGCSVQTQLETPQNLRIDQSILYWDEVAGADSYIVSMNDEIFEVTSNSFDAFDYTMQPGNYTFSVFAQSDRKNCADSNWAEDLDYTVKYQGEFLFRNNAEGTGLEIMVDRPEKTVGKVVIPAEIGGVPVVTILGSGFEGCTEMTELILPDTITEIMGGAFASCTALARVHLPAGLETISGSLFYECTSLWDVTIPATVTQIGSYAFSFCPSLMQLTVAEENPVFYSKGNCVIRRADRVLVLGCAGSVIPEGVTEIGRNAFSGCTGLTQIEIPGSVTKIESFAFSDCTGLTQIEIPGSVETIGMYAFSRCTALTRVKIGEGVKVLESYVFQGCTALEEVSLPKSLESCAPAFSACTSLERLEVEEGNPIYYSEGNCIVRRADKTLVAGCATSVIPQGVEVIGSSAFVYCYELREITIPDSVKEIGSGAFLFCYRLETVRIPNSVERIGAGAFGYCVSLAGVVIPESVKEMGGDAFGHTFVYVAPSSNPGGWGEERAPWAQSMAIFWGCTIAYDGSYPYVVSTGEELCYDAYTPCREGYTFAGWATEEGGEVVYAADDKLIDHSATLANNVVLSGKYEYTHRCAITREEFREIPEGTKLFAVWVPNM